MLERASVLVATQSVIEIENGSEKMKNWTMSSTLSAFVHDGGSVEEKRACNDERDGNVWEESGHRGDMDLEVMGSVQQGVTWASHPFPFFCGLRTSWVEENAAAGSANETGL